MPETGVATATWREDGFVSLDAESEGACTTLILDFTGAKMRLNAWTRFGGEILVELADASNDNRRVHAPAIQGRSFEDCDPITGDSVSHTVTWKASQTCRSGPAGRCASGLGCAGRGYTQCSLCRWRRANKAFVRPGNGTYRSPTA